MSFDISDDINLVLSEESEQDLDQRETISSDADNIDDILPSTDSCSRCDKRLEEEFGWQYCPKFGCIQIHHIICYKSQGCSCTETPLDLNSSP